MFASVPGIGGSTVLGTGEVALILDVPGLVQRALARQGNGKRLGRASGGPVISQEKQHERV
jgi:chemotaxis protein histidine kinase CheA